MSVTITYPVGGGSVDLTGPITSLAGVTSIASQTGTGSKFVVDTSPTLITPTFSGLATGAISGNAGTVTTNANLTGPITSVGNATSITSQTGTGSKFVVDTSPAISNCTFTGTTTLDAITFTGSSAFDFNARAFSNFVSTVNAQVGTTYTVLAADCGKIITCSNAAAITVTVNTNLPDGGSVTIAQKGAGQVTVAVSGLTIRNRSSFTKTAGQYAAVTLFRNGTDLYLTGDGA